MSPESVISNGSDVAGLTDAAAMHHTVVVSTQKNTYLNLCRENAHANETQSWTGHRHSLCETASAIKSLPGHRPAINLWFIIR